jgi:hypothetical protein
MSDRLAPRARSAAVRQNARPLGRGQGELYKNVYLPYRARKPTKRTPALQGGEASQKLGKHKAGGASKLFVFGVPVL